MLKLLVFLSILMSAFPALCQPAAKYQVGTITDVSVHQASEAAASDATSYDVSVKVGDTIYVVLYTPQLGEQTVKYIAGRELLVLVGKNTIRYNDILGRSRELPIENRKPAANPRGSKTVSSGAQ